jgi:hypothetical protein
MSRRYVFETYVVHFSFILRRGQWIARGQNRNHVLHSRVLPQYHTGKSFICLFNDAVPSAQFIKHRKEQMNLDNDLERMWKKVSYFQASIRPFAVRTEVTH